MKVNNINGTSDTTCKCGSWLKHWENFSGQTVPTYCPVSGCLEKSLVGADVQKDNSTDKSWYIVPLCTKHNAETGKSLEISGSCKFATANKSNTCERK